MESPVPDKRVSLVFSPSALTALYQGLTAKTRAPGNKAPIGGLKVIARSDWFAARPSGTADNGDPSPREVRR